MAEAWAYEKRGDMGIVSDENGLPVCMRVSEEDGSIIASAPLLAERVRILREALATIKAWDPVAAPDEPGGMSIMDAIDIASAALETTKEGA